MTVNQALPAFGRVIAVVLVLVFSVTISAQEREIDPSGQTRLRYSFDLPAEIQMARNFAQAKPGKSAEFASYTQKINELELLVLQLQDMEQNQVSAELISAQQTLVSAKVQEIVFLVPNVLAPDDSLILEMARRLFGY